MALLRIMGGAVLILRGVTWIVGRLAQRLRPVPPLPNKASGDTNNPLAPPPLGVFLYDELSEVGYPQSAKGIPDKDWFHGSGGKPRLQALQTDFIWRMPFFAKSLATPK